MKPDMGIHLARTGRHALLCINMFSLRVKLRFMFAATRIGIDACDISSNVGSIMH